MLTEQSSLLARAMCPTPISVVQVDSQNNAPPNIAAHRSMAAALNGNYQPLTKRLRSGVILRRDEREFLADLVTGKIRKPTHRQRSHITDEEQFGVATFVEIYRCIHDVKLESAVARAMATFPDISRSYVFKALKTLHTDPERAAVAKVFGKAIRDLSAPNPSGEDSKPIPEEKILRLRLHTPLLYRSHKSEVS